MLCRFNLIVIGLLAVGSANATSQLAPLYEALAKDPRSGDGFAVDLAMVVPSEEIPVIVRAIESGNPAVMDAAARNAATILQVHKTDGENPDFNRLKPPLAEVAKEFQALVPVLASHFGDREPELVGALSKDSENNTPWKIEVVRLTDLIGARPTQEMLAWMLRVVEWPNGRAQEYVARIENETGLLPKAGPTHEAFLKTMMDRFRADTLAVAPVLSHLDPMPASVLGVLMNKIDDPKEPQVAVAIIRGLSENKALGAGVADRLVLKALESGAPVDVRVASIYAVGKLKRSDLSRLAGLPANVDDRITRAMIDVGVPQ